MIINSNILIIAISLKINKFNEAEPKLRRKSDQSFENVVILNIKNEPHSKIKHDLSR